MPWFYHIFTFARRIQCDYIRPIDVNKEVILGPGRFGRVSMVVVVVVVVGFIIAGVVVVVVVVMRHNDNTENMWSDNSAI